MMRKFLSFVLALVVALSTFSINLITVSAATVDLDRAAAYTFEEGNIARDSAVNQYAGGLSGTSANNALYDPSTDTPNDVGITFNYRNTTNGNADVQAKRLVDANLTHNGWNTWGGSQGTSSNPLYVVMTWPESYIIDATRVRWWVDGGGTLVPTSATVEYWNGSAWLAVSNMKDSSGTSVSSIGVTASTWHGVTFDPVVTNRLRLRIIKSASGTNGLSMSEWEIFGTKDPAMSDLNSINAIILQNMVADVVLPTTGPNGSVITWSDSTNSALTTSGVVTRPSAGSSNASGTIKATAVHESGTATRVFDFTVLREVPNAQTPNITVQPQANVAINADNQSATLSVTATISDEGTLSYQWFKNTSASSVGGVEIPGATANTFEVPVNESGTLYYYVVVTNTNTAADNPIATASSIVSTVTVTPYLTELEINPVNGLNPMRYTNNGGPGSPKFRDHFRFGTENTFIRPGESVKYNFKVKAVGMDPTPIWSITGGVAGTTISQDGKLTVSPTQPKGDIIVTATIGDLSVSATVTVRIVNDEKGYDQRAKWTAEPFSLSNVTLDGDNLWTKNKDITIRYLLQGDREERHLQYFYMTAGITELPVEINGKPTGTAVQSIAAPLGWDGIGYATTSRVWQRALSGHGTGHYLSAISKAYQVTSNDVYKTTFRNKMKLMVQELGRIQDTNIEKGSYMYGFLSAYSEHQFDVLEEDKGRTPTTGETNGRAAWAIYYTQHKIIQGLVDIYKVLNGTDEDATAQRALEIASKMGDWTYLRLSRWTQADRENMWNVYSAGEVGGIAQPIEELFFITGDELYRETASFFEHNNNWNSSGNTGMTVMGTGADAGYETSPGDVRATTRSGDAFFAHFAKNQDGNWLNGKHANTIVPMIISALREYEADTPLDNDRINPVGYTPAPTHYYDIARNFFQTVYTTRISPIGGTANGEIWQNIGNPVTPSWSTHLGTGSSSSTTGSNESCTTVNMMLLASSLFRHDQRAEYFDYYERALINHVMPTLAQNSGATQNRIDYLRVMNAYSPTGYDRYGDGACCNGTGMEVHTSYQEQVYSKTKDGKGLYVNLYMPTTLNWAEKGFQIVQESEYLNEGKSIITVNGNGPLDIKLRVPYWIEKGFEVKINGDIVIENAARSSYVTLSRTWTTGDVIEITMPFSVRFERSPENTTGTTVAMFYGPVMMIQKPGTTTRPTISGINFADIDSSFTKTTGPETTHAFGNYTSFRLTNGDQNYDPMYTATPSGSSTSLNYCANFTVARNNDNVAVTRSVVGSGGLVSTSSNNREVTDGQLVNRGSIVTFTATPDDGYKVKEWKLNGLTVGNNNSNTYIVTGINSDVAVTVSFVPENLEEGTVFSLDKLEASKKLDAITHITTPVNGSVYLAMYKDDNLIDVAVSEFNADPNNLQSIVTSINLPADITGITVKAFVWNNELSPILPPAMIDGTM